MRRLISPSLALFALCSARIAAAATYVVAPGGSDNNDGINKPWATLQHAADMVKAGDTVQVKAGSYQGFDAQNGGTQGAPVTFTAEAGTLITSENPDTPDGINIENCSYVIVEGFTVNGMQRTGIRTAVGDHITIRKNQMDKNGVWGILTGHVDDLDIEDNVTSNSVQQHGIYVGNSGDRPIIRHNVVWGNSGNGIHMNGDVSQGGDGIISNAVVERNMIYQNGVTGGSGINCDGVQDSVIQNNLIYAEHASGISLYMIDAAEPAKNNLVVNNTIVEASDGRWALNIKDGSTGVTAYNNVFFNLNPAHGSISIDSASLPGLTSDFNAVMDLFDIDDNFIQLGDWRQMTGQDKTSFVGNINTFFLDLAKDDYHLAANSPGIDNGTSMKAPAEDLDGTARPQGMGIDVGCYELCTNGCNPATTSSTGTSMSGTGGSSSITGTGGASTTASSASGSADAGAGGSGAAGDNPTPGDTGGCGCGVAGDSREGILGIALAALVFLARRRRPQA